MSTYSGDMNGFSFSWYSYPLPLHLKWFISRCLVSCITRPSYHSITIRKSCEACWTRASIASGESCKGSVGISWGGSLEVRSKEKLQWNRSITVSTTLHRPFASFAQLTSGLGLHSSACTFSFRADCCKLCFMELWLVWTVSATVF